MEDTDSLSRLQDLQADLVAFSESRLPTLERLWAELEGSIEDFRRLLETQRRNDKSRQALKADTIKLDGLEYSINEDFRQNVIEVADELDLDELEAAKLFINSQDSAEELGRPTAVASVIRFHSQRATLLECLRLSLQQASDVDTDPDQRGIFQTLVQHVVGGDQKNLASDTAYWRKCISTMSDIEAWMGRLNARAAGASIIGQSDANNAAELLVYQNDSLTKQHESLAAISSHLVKEGHASIDDYRFLMTRTATLERLDNVALHYVPLLMTCASTFGPVDSPSSLREARGLDQVFADTTDQSRWRLQELRAAATCWWLAEYSGRYIDNPVGSPLQGVNLEAENNARFERFFTALREGAFECMLTLCSKVRVEKWYDPAKAGLVQYLLAGSETARTVSLTASAHFENLLAENLQAFIDAFITNMPDTLRRLKFEEDEHRRNRLPQTLQELPPGHDIDLERFLMIISYAFHDFPEAAQAFWSDPDGNLYGFLQWASKRQSTPRVAAFCEMFQAIAENEESADAAHKFLLEDTTSTTSRLRKSNSLSWGQIFEELSIYANINKDRPVVSSYQAEQRLAGEITEPESAIMLECYLRLASHLSRTSSAAREYLLSHPTFHLHEVLFELARSGIESRLKACVFNALSSLLTDKPVEVNDAMWSILDQWIFNVPQPNQAKQSPAQMRPDLADRIMLESLANGFEEPNAVIGFLQTLVTPATAQSPLHDILPFPEQLGSAYRMPGMDQYVDFVLGLVFAIKLQELTDADQIWELRCTCLSFISMCLSTFNEDLVVFANNTSLSVDAAISTSSLAAYVRLHPFSRIMEWMFNDGVIAALFASAQESVEVVSMAAPDSPMVLSMCGAIEVMDLVLKLQSTYFDIVRPIVKTQSVARGSNVANPAFASFEDAILNNINVVRNLSLYCGTAHQDLTIVSLRLMHRLATSRKLAIASGSNVPGRQSSNRVLTVLQQDGGFDQVAAAFIAPMQLGQREYEMAEAAPGYAIKQAILALLNSSLDTSPNRPALAHCLLGFQCSDRSISISADSLFAKGTSLFHAVVRLCAEITAMEEVNVLPWLSALRHSASEIIRKLVRSTLTGDIVLEDLREAGFFEAAALAQMPVSPDTPWAGRPCSDPDFLINDSSTIFRDFLNQRAAFYEYASLALRSTLQRNVSSQRQKVLSSLLGVTTVPSLEQAESASVFELFDFVDIDISTVPALSQQKFFGGLDFEICRRGDAKSGLIYDMTLVHELLLLAEADLRRRGDLADAAVEQLCLQEADGIRLILQARNQRAAVMMAQGAALNAWTQLVTLMLMTGDLEPPAKSAFVLQALQIVLPKFDKGLAEDSSNTSALAKLTHTLVRAAGSGLTELSSKEGNVANERLLHAFRTALKGIGVATESVGLRETCYQIVRHFIKSITSAPSGQSAVLRQSMKIIESAGERLIESICEDALSSQGTCRISAVLMLESCVQLFQVGKTSNIVHALTRLNFTAVLVDSIRSIAAEFQEQRPGQGKRTRLPTLKCFC